MDWFKEASGYNFEHSSNIQLMLEKIFLYAYVQPKGLDEFFHNKHIAKCMWSSLKF